MQALSEISADHRSLSFSLHSDNTMLTPGIASFTIGVQFSKARLTCHPGQHCNASFANNLT